MSEIRDTEKVAKKLYAYTVAELQRLRNKEARQFCKSYTVCSSSSITRPNSSKEVTPFNIFTMPSWAIERIC